MKFLKKKIRNWLLLIKFFQVRILLVFRMSRFLMSHHLKAKNLIKFIPLILLRRLTVPAMCIRR